MENKIKSPLCSHHCTRWWPCAMPCQDICRQSDDKVQVLYISHWGRDKMAAVLQWVFEWLNLTGLSGDSRQRGPYSLYKPCNHSLYIGIIIFHLIIYNPQYTGHNLLLRKKILKKKQKKKWGHPLGWLVIGDSKSTSVYNYSKYLTSSLDWNRATDCNNKLTRRKEKR